MKEFFKGLSSLWKIGFKSYLIYVYLLFVLVYIIDFYIQGFSFQTLKYIYFDVNFFTQTLLFFTALLLSIPVLIGIVRVLVGPIHTNNLIIERIFSFKNKYSYYVLFILLVVLSVLFYSMCYLINSKGFSLNPVNKETNLSAPIFYLLALKAIKYLNLIAVLSFIAGFLPSLLNAKNENINRFWTKVNLADLNGDYYPIHKRKELNFNNGAITPRIKFIDRLAKNKIIEYHKSVPGSKNAVLAPQ